MPGAAVHGPLILGSAMAGYFLCWPHPLLRPLLVVWVLAGVYLGRDITILCHYNPLLTLLSWAAFVLVVLNPARMAKFGAAHTAISGVLSLALATILLLVAVAMTRQKASRPSQTESQA